MGTWFDTGLVMNDAKTKRTVYAKSEVEKEEFLKKGWKVIEKKAPVARRRVVKKASKETVARKQSEGKTRNE